MRIHILMRINILNILTRRRGTRENAGETTTVREKPPTISHVSVALLVYGFLSCEYQTYELLQTYTRVGWSFTSTTRLR